MTPILTDHAGVPIEKPMRKDYLNDTLYIRAFWTYKDRIATIANAAFDAGFRAGLKK